MLPLQVCAAALAIAGLSTWSRAQSTAPAEPPTSAKPATTDPTARFRRPGELVAACGALVVKDVGLWPDMQAALEGKGPLYVNRAMQGAINSRGDVVVVLDALPPDGVSRNKELGTVQFAIKGRPSTGVLNERGDLFGQLIIDNPGDAKKRRYVTRTFVLKAESDSPVYIDVPEDYELQPCRLYDDGTGLAQLIKGHSNEGEVATIPVCVALDRASNRYTITPLIDHSKLPRGTMDCVPVCVDAKGAIAVGIQIPTGELLSGAFRDEGGKMVQTCPSFIQTVSQAAVIRGDKLELLPLPALATSVSPDAGAEDGTLICMAKRWEGKALYRDGYIWKDGRFSPLSVFPGDGLVQPTGASGTLACGVMMLSERALAGGGAAPGMNGVTDLRSSGVLWSLATGEYLTLDALLPTEYPCSHISSAQAMRGDKVLCTGYIAGKLHALVVTLPAGVGRAFAAPK